MGERKGRIMKKSLKYLVLTLLVILGGVALAGCGSKEALAKEEDAFMIQAVSATSADVAKEAKVDPSLTADSSGKITIGADVDVKLGEGVTEIIDDLLAQIEALVDSIEIKHEQSDREGYEKLMSYSQTNLKGEKVEYKLYYNITDYEEDDDDELEIEIEYKGLLIITIGEETYEYPVEGEVEIEEGERVTKVVRENEDGKVTIKSKMEKGSRKFEYKIEPKVGVTTEFELEIKNTRNGVKIEIETKVGKSELKFKFHITKNKEVRNVKVEVELDDFNIFIGEIDAKLNVDVKITKNQNQFKHQFKIQGKFKFKSLISDDEVESQLNFETETTHE